MKILSAEQIRQADAHTIANEPIASVDLMERAATRATELFETITDTARPVHIFCGTGNNGGDGLVMARLLAEKGLSVSCYAVRFSDNSSQDFMINEERLAAVDLIDIREGDPFPVLSPNDTVLDCIFGSGLSRPAEGFTADLIVSLNNSGATIVAIDIPSGLFADQASTGAIVEADHTITFQVPKLSFMMPENGQYTGKVHIVDIGLDPGFIETTESPYIYVDSPVASKIYTPREKFGHKGTYGHSLLIAGGEGKMGAAILAGAACLRSGSGLLTLHIPSGSASIIQSGLPDAMVSLDSNDQHYSTLPDIDKYTTIGVGPGLGTDLSTIDGLRQVLTCGKPLVLDADALNCIVKGDMIRDIPPGSILTPHPKEFERLAGKWADDMERLAKQEAFAKDVNCIVVLKGAHTSIALPSGEVYFNSTGNPGLAVGGSGDVLTGIITALLAQGYSSADAAVLGVYLHGAAADHIVKDHAPESLMASDLTEALSEAFLSVE